MSQREMSDTGKHSMKEIREEAARNRSGNWRDRIFTFNGFVIGALLFILIATASSLWVGWRIQEQAQLRAEARAERTAAAVEEIVQHIDDLGDIRTDEHERMVELLEELVHEIQQDRQGDQ